MITVIKASGEKEPFSEEKINASIKRAGIPESLHEQVLAHVKSKLYENIPTSEIYSHITEFLKTSTHPFSGANYSLKHALMDLGPTGYPFEDFVSELLEQEGYKTQVRQILSGKCVTHEVDVIAEKNGIKCMFEAKFHNTPGSRSDVQVSLYTKARFDDVKEKYDLKEAWVVTNTKVTSDALSYALCVEMKILSWNYPENESLRDLIEKSRLHPITVLSSLSSSQRQKLLDQDIVLCKDIYENPKSLQILDLPKDKQEEVMSEVKFVIETERIK